MSLEAWGDDDGAGEYDHLLDAGWWDDQKVEEVKTAIIAVLRATVYENRQKANGISEEIIGALLELRRVAEIEEPPDAR